MATLDELLLHQPPAQEGQAGSDGTDGVFMKNLFKSLIQGTRASNAIPPGGIGGGGEGGGEASEFAYHAAISPVFAEKANEASETVLTLLKKLVRHMRKAEGEVEEEEAGVDEEDDDFLLAGLEDAEDPAAFESLADFMEDLLDNVEGYLMNKGKKEGEGSEGGREGGTSAAATMSNASWERLRNMVGAARQTAMASRYKIMLSQTLDIPKPQEAFRSEIDNRRETCFRPWSWREGGREEGQGQETESPHPFETEIRNFSYMPWQLEVPGEEAVQLQKPLALEQSEAVTLVDTVEGLKDAVQVVREELEEEGEEEGGGEKMIAVDLEAHSMRSFQGLVCLMQLSTRKRDFLIDTLQVEVRRAIGPLLLDLFTDHTVVKVFHGADSDIKWLQRDFGLYVVNLFDTFLAAQALGFSSKSLAYLLHNYMGVTADKQYQLADWRVRPLPEIMQRYAREDTHYLLYIFDCLRRELGREGGRVRRVWDGSRE
eukprot:evm.model.NODE_37039_length_7374_cov_22.076756.4